MLLRLLAQAGIPNAEVLRIATPDGAEGFRILSETGTVEPGKPRTWSCSEAAAASATAVAVSLQWQVAEPTARFFELQYREAGTDWSPGPTVSGPVTTQLTLDSRSLSPGRIYEFRARIRTTSGRYSSYSN